MSEAITFSSLYVPNDALHIKKGDFGPIDPDRLLILTQRLENIKRWGRLGRLSLSAEEGEVSYIENNKYVGASTERAVLVNQRQGVDRIYSRTDTEITMNAAEVRRRVEIAVAETGMSRDTAWNIMIDRSLRRGIRSAAIKNLGKNPANDFWGSVVDNVIDIVVAGNIYIWDVPLAGIWGFIYGKKLWGEHKKGHKLTDRYNSLLPTYSWHIDRMAIAGLLATTQRLAVHRQE